MENGGARTASGKKAKQGRTIAVDKRKDQIRIKSTDQWKTYAAEDVGGGVSENISMYSLNLINRQRDLVRKQVLKFIR